MTKSIFVAGHAGMFGSALVRKLSEDPKNKIVTASKHELDLRDQRSVRDFFSAENFDEIYLAAARVGGIYANSAYPADFIYDNLMMQCNTIHAAAKANIKKLLFLGSSCIYPKYAQQPISEAQLLTAALEPTNEPYAIAKIAGLKLCESYNRQFGESLDLDYRSIMPTNLYGPGDNFNLENSHVIPGLMRRLHEAKVSGQSRLLGWGTGEVKREFLHVDDAADAAVFLMNLARDDYSKEVEDTRYHINVGTGFDLTIKELMSTLVNVVGYEGEVDFNGSLLDGPPRKLLDCTRLKRLGWEPKISLIDGLRSTYDWFLENEVDIRR